MSAAAADGQHLTLVAGGARATVGTRGAALIGLEVDGVAVVVRGPPGPCRPEEFRGVVLAPWPNRTEPRYVVDGRAFELPANEASTGAALHGLVYRREWSVSAVDADRAVLETLLGEDPGYPFRVHLTAEFRVAPNGIAAEIRARNEGAERAPVGLGVHPYLSAGVPVDATGVDVPASQVLVLGPRGIPTAPPQPVAGTSLDLRGGVTIGRRELDHAYVPDQRGRDGRLRVELSGGSRRVTLTAGAAARCVMVFTADTLPPPSCRAAIAVEPMTCPPGAFATGDGLALLEPGQTLALAWSLAVEYEGVSRRRG